MATRPGEENVATLFGDIHYFYSPPESKPRHHRFDKGSYVYLFENAYERRCRVEIANNPGTDEQDAFDGYLDQARVRYSYKQHCTVSLTVADAVEQNQWHLPTYDPHNQNKYHYKLHSLDIYFWTHKDALAFVNGVRRVLPPNLVEVLDEPLPGPPPQPSAHTTGMSAVVQKLESVAIADTQQHQQGSQQGSSQPSAQSFAPPPPPPPPVTHDGGSSTQSPAQPANFAPMAYNPSAPAAPEQVQYREKTPPPDEDPLNPLSVAVAQDYSKQPFTPAFAPQHAQYPGGLMSPGFQQPIASPGMTHFAPPPQMMPQHPHPGVHRAATMPAYGSLNSPGLASPFGATFPGAQQQAQAPEFPGPLPPPPTQLPQLQQPPHLSAHSTPQPPVGGFSNYSYTEQPQSQGGGADYSIHQQLYRPTEAEASHGHGPKTYQPKSEGRGKLEENVGRVGKGVTGMLKKFEKRFG